MELRITVSMGRDAQDKQIGHFKTWKPDRPMTVRQMEKEAQRVALEFEREITLGFQTDNRQTFEQYARKGQKHPAAQRRSKSADVGGTAGGNQDGPKAILRVMESEDATPEQILRAAELLAQIGKW